MDENSVMLQLYLWYYLHNTVFKIKHKLYIPTGSQSCPPPRTPGKQIWVCIWAWLYCTLIILYHFTISSVIQTSLCQIVQWFVNDGLEWMRNDVTVAWLRYYPGICVDGLRKNMETISLDSQWPGQDLNQVSPNTSPDVPALSAYSVMH